MMVDVNVSLSRWPFRHLPHDELPKFVEKLQAVGVTQAWAGSFDGLFHKDVAGVNARLADDCRQSPSRLLRPFGTINPMLPDWHEDLRRCVEVHRMAGIRLHPNYHGYQLDDPVCAELLALAARRQLLVQLAVRVEDPRVQHPLMRVPDVDTRPLAGLVDNCRQLQVVLLNSLQTLRGETLQTLAATGRVYFEIATLEGVGGIARLLKQIPPDQLLLGSHFPFFILESALLKLRESDLAADQLAAIMHGNARRLLP